MKNLLNLMLSASTLLAAQTINAQNCNSLEIKLNKEVKAKNYTAAYPILNEALTSCAKEKINVYNFGETILVEKIETAATDTEKQKYANELAQLIDKRIQNFPGEKKAFWQGEKINYQLKYGVLDKKQAYDAYKELFTAKDKDADTQKLSANTVLTYYSTALELMNESTIEFEEALDVYFQTKKVAEDNIELRSVEYGTLAEKLDSIQKIDPNNQLTAAEKQTMENAQSAKDVFVEVNESMESVLAQYTTCDNIAPMFVNKYEANKDSLEWLAGSYQALAAKDCYDQPIMAKLEERYTKLWKEKNPSAATAVASNSGGTVGSSFGSGARKFKAGNYSGAIADFKKAINEVSGTTKGDVAYYLALSYQKSGSLSSAVSWAKKAANYKPGWGAPYQLIASAFGSSANSCGSSQFDKLATYWVAADYANKACSVDSRSCGWARSAAKSYEATAPSQEMIFSQGKKKGQTVRVNCLGGATTRVR